MRRCVVIGGAKIHCYNVIKPYLSENDFYIYCDSGLRHQKGLGRKPDLIIGDFDSFQKPDVDIETIVLPREKDDTDTVFAVKEAVKRGYQEFLLVGVTGGRFDHTFGNVSLLLYLHRLGKKAQIVDDDCEMEIVSEDIVKITDQYSYFSLLNIDGTAKGITEENVKFPLHDATIPSEYQYGISNEVLKGKTARVCVKEGRALLVKIRKE